MTTITPMPIRVKVIDFSTEFSDAYGPLSSFVSSRPPYRGALVVWDGNHLANRIGYTHELDSPNGKPTEVVVGIVDAMQAVGRIIGTRRHVVCFDGSVRARRSIFSGYKVRHHAELTPEETRKRERVREATALAITTLRALGIRVVHSPHVEGDDFIGAVARRASECGSHVIVISDDKDFYQLCAPGIAVYRAIAKQGVTAKDYERLFGFPAFYHPVYKSMVGEPATGDNIPGVRGVGDVTAGKIIGAALATFETLPKRSELVETIISTAANAVAKGKSRAIEKAIVSAAEDIRLSFRLARIPRLRGEWLNTGYTEADYRDVQQHVGIAIDDLDRPGLISSDRLAKVKGSLGWATLSAERLALCGVTVK